MSEMSKDKRTLDRMSWLSCCGLVPSATQQCLGTCAFRLGRQRQHCCLVTVEIDVS